MPTAKPRITITLEPHTHEVLSRLSSATGQSMASFVTGLVETAGPALVRMAVVMERAKGASEEVRAGFAAAVERAEQSALPGVMAALDQSDLFLADMESAVGVPAADAQRPRKVARSANPRPVTRG